jgi:hypothetical protein
MPSLDEMFLAPTAVVATLLGLVSMLVAGSRGAKSAASLAPARHLLAMGMGLAPGGLLLAGGLLLVVATASGMAVALAVLSLSSVAGAVVAYKAAQAAGVRMSRYQCRGCGLKFYSRFAADDCPECRARREELESRRTAAEFQARYRDLP